MHELWKGMKETRKQQLCYQRREIEEKHWLEEFETEMIKQKIEGERTKDTEMAPAVQIGKKSTLNCLKQETMTKHLIGVRLRWRVHMRHQRHRV